MYVTIKELIEFLKNAGFSISAAQGGWLISGRDIDGIIFDLDWDWQLAVDHVDCYCKPSKCPLQFKMLEMQPEYSSNQEFLDSLLEKLKFLGTKEGYEISNSYGYFQNNPFDMKRKNEI